MAHQRRELIKMPSTGSRVGRRGMALSRKNGAVGQLEAKLLPKNCFVLKTKWRRNAEGRHSKPEAKSTSLNGSDSLSRAGEGAD